MTNKGMPGEDIVIEAKQELLNGLTKLLHVLPQLPTWEYEVQKGDTLWSIAKNHTESPQRWREIYFMNLAEIIKYQHIYNAHEGSTTVYEGMKLRLPGY